MARWARLGPADGDGTVEEKLTELKRLVEGAAWSAWVLEPVSAGCIVRGGGGEGEGDETARPSEGGARGRW